MNNIKHPKILELTKYEVTDDEGLPVENCKGPTYKIEPWSYATKTEVAYNYKTGRILWAEPVNGVLDSDWELINGPKAEETVIHTKEKVKLTTNQAIMLKAISVPE